MSDKDIEEDTVEVRKHQKVTSRNDVFADKITTRIWEEVPSENNPYIASNNRCHGYDLIELMQQKSYVDMFYLLFRGNLPSLDERQLLEQLMVGLINPGPRHPATRAAMNAGVGKSDPQNILPISLTIMGGEYLGAGAVEGAMRFMRKHRRENPVETADAMLTELAEQRPKEGDWHIAPGFGSHFGGVDLMPSKLAAVLARLPASGSMLDWGMGFSSALNKKEIGWLTVGVAAAVFADLGFHPRYGAGLFQLLCAPGLLAHGMEQANKPITAMPFVSDKAYVIDYE
ncbi:MAG: citrate synthase [Gammaproteobacteria bacterium]|nr:citrate synthase [Gammaproteobacteria bacterium]